MFKFRYLIFLFIAHSAHALTTLHVSSSSDNNPGSTGDPGDLRFALNTMNQNLNSSFDDYDIVFDFPMTIQLNGILPIINNSSNPVNITIGNPGSIPTVTIDGNSGAYPGFFMPMGNVTIQNMTFQNLTAKGGNGGDGISGGGGGMGAGGAIYAPSTFLNGSSPSITLKNVLINSCSAVGGTGGSYLGGSSTGDEGGGGGGGFSGNGGSITTVGSTGGAGGGGFGGDGGAVTLSTSDPNGGGGGGGGGIGSRATLGTPTNLGNGGADNSIGQPGNGYGLSNVGGSGAGGHAGANNAGGGGGGDIAGGSAAGGGGGGVGLSAGASDGVNPQGSTPPGGSALPSGGNGADGGGGGGGGVVITSSTNNIDGQAGTGGYGAGGGGGAGTGASDSGYTVQGGLGGVGGGGGGGGIDQSGTTSADGGSSQGGGGGAGGGPSNGSTALGGTDTGKLGGGAGGSGSNTVGSGFGGGGGGGGSGLGGAIFVDGGLNFVIEAFAGIPTTFNTTNNTVQAGAGGSEGSGGGAPGLAGSALGNSIFLRSGSSLTFIANGVNDLLTLGDQVSFVDDSSFSAGGTSVFVRGNGTVVYNGTSDYEGSIMVNNANFKVKGLIDQASISVCRNTGFSSQRGTLSGTGTLTGDVFVNSGTISPDAGNTLTLGTLTLSPASSGALGSLVHIEIDSGGTSLASVTGPASLAGILEIQLDSDALPGSYTILSSSGITGTFDSVRFIGATPNYSLSYVPAGSPTQVRFDFLGYPSSTILSPSNLDGVQKKNNFGFEYELYNQLSWTPSQSSGVIGYYVYRDGINIATVDAFTYQDHNRPVGVSFVYSIVAFDSNGNTSSPVSVTIPGA